MHELDRRLLACELFNFLMVVVHDTAVKYSSERGQSGGVIAVERLWVGAPITIYIFWHTQLV